MSTTYRLIPGEKQRNISNIRANMKYLSRCRQTKLTKICMQLAVSSDGKSSSLDFRLDLPNDVHQGLRLVQQTSTTPQTGHAASRSIGPQGEHLLGRGQGLRFLRVCPDADGARLYCGKESRGKFNNMAYVFTGSGS